KCLRKFWAKGNLHLRLASLGGVDFNHTASVTGWCQGVNKFLDFCLREAEALLRSNPVGAWCAGRSCNILNGAETSNTPTGEELYLAGIHLRLSAVIVTPVTTAMITPDTTAGQMACF